MKYNTIIADCPWSFSDSLKMSEVKRGAAANYNTLSIDDLCALDVPSITEDDCVLYLWTPSSLLEDGLKVMRVWGFNQKQTLIWVKTKKEPFGNLISYIKKYIKSVDSIADLLDILGKFDLTDILSFNMGRLHRQTHELCLIGVKGNIYKHLKNKSQRSVIFDKNEGHSCKSEKLQDAIDLMFPDFGKEKKLEMFARRQREGWTCVGLECPGDFIGEKINESIERLKVI